MNDDKKLIGNRLKIIRQTYQGAYHKTALEFSEYFGENEFNVRNYEAGKAGVPARLLSSLSKFGFNAHYILTGEGAIYAGTSKGAALEEKIEGKRTAAPNIEININKIETLSIDDLMEKAGKLNAAAGDIMRIIQERSKGNK